MFQNDKINVIIISVLWKNLCFSNKIRYNKYWNSKREINWLKFIIVSVAVAELSLVLFGALPRPYNVFEIGRAHV